MDTTTASPTDVFPEPALLQEVHDLNERGLYLQAYHAALRAGPLQAWRGTPGRLLAGRLANSLGAPRLSLTHLLRAYREDPQNGEATYHHVRAMLSERGPLEAWTRLSRSALPADAEADLQTRWLTLQARILCRFRDFDAAEAYLTRAESFCPDHVSLFQSRADLLERQDRHADALAVLRACLERYPRHRTAIQDIAELLGTLHRPDEALTLLQDAAPYLESAAIWAQIASLQTEREQFAEAERSLAEYERCSPLLETAGVKWLAGRRADCAYGQGQLTVALEWARQGRGKFWEIVAERLAAADLSQPPVRRILPLGFVRQHHQTCAPATLAVLAQFWSMPGDHLELAERITYEGTPAHSQRRWAEENGWIAREFTVTWENAVALLDRGLPFALTTASLSSAHLQAINGYDALRGTFFIRDPGDFRQREVLASSFLEHYRSIGPRGLVLVPCAEAGRLENVPLLDAEKYDHYQRLRSALAVHNRAEATEALQAMQAQDPEHRITLEARRTLANYDGNPADLLEVLDRLLVLFPHDLIIQIGKFHCLRDLARGEERLALLRGLCKTESPDPVCLQMYARELLSDAREFATARHLLRQAIRGNTSDADHYLYLAHAYWDQDRRAEAFVLYRFAACLDDKGEAYAQAYFRAARWLNRTEEAIAFLRARFTRFGRKSGYPARTLARSLSDLERSVEALSVLDEALRLRPEDGELCLTAASHHLDSGHFARAEELIEAARDRAHVLSWLRLSARLKSAQGKVDEALQVWQQIVEKDPFSIDAHRNLVQLLAGLRGRPAALEHLHAVCTRFPHNYDLTKLWNEWLREDDLPAAEQLLRRLLDSHPTSSWAYRELAMHLSNQGRCEEAFVALERAAELEPRSASLFNVRAHVLERAGRLDETRETYRASLRLDVDSSLAIRSLIRLCGNLSERREVIAFIASELNRQVLFGDALFAFQQCARNTLEPDELLATLQTLLATRSDVWQAWSALTDQLLDMRRFDEAYDHARRAVERFPLLPTLWVDLARVCYLRKNSDEEIANLRQALAINPSWGRPLRLLADTFERLGRFGQARETLERAVLLAPLSSANYFSLADILWKQRARQQAIERLQHGLRLDPLEPAQWGTLCEWAKELKQPRLAIDFANELTTRRPVESRLWVALGRALTLEEGKTDEVLAAFDRALQLNPSLVEAHERKVDLLIRAKRFDEAHAACQAPVWKGKPPPSLRLRLAVIHAEQRDYVRAKTIVREVLHEDPNSYRGWNYLADWSEATSTWEEYREASEHMVRLAPHTSTAYGYRGAARLRTGDRVGAKEDYRYALHLMPDYIWAAFELFDAHFEDNELHEAARALRHVRRYRRNEFSLARSCQLLARRGKQRPALRVLRRLCLSDHTATWPLEAAEEACFAARWRGAVDGLYATLLEHPRCRVQVAVQWGGRVERGPGWHSAKQLIPRALELLDREITERPRNFSPHDVKALLLSLVERHDEAEAACAHPAQEKSHYLRGRLSWVYAQRGDYTRACESISAVLKDHPNYSWGWRQLASWTEETEDWPKHLEATENMVRLSPRSAMSYGYRGEARFRMDNHEGAKDDFRMSLQIDPSYSFGVGRYFDLCLEDGEQEECERSLEALKKYRNDETTWRRIGRLAVSRDNKEEALSWVRKLCLSGHASTWPLQDLHDACVAKRWGSDLEKLYAEVLPLPDCRPQTAVLWVDRADEETLAKETALRQRAHELFDQSIAAQPQEFKPYDFKAMLYCAEERFDEAEAICRHPAVAHKISMKGRLGWVQKKAGRYTRGIMTSRSCVEESPGYTWAWYNLMDWAGEIDAYEFRRWAADGYIRANPKRAVGYRHRAHARRDLDDKVGAIEDYRLCRQYEPRNNVTALNLFDVLLEVGDTTQATAVLDEIREKVYRVYRLSLESRLAVQLGQQAEAQEKLLQLCEYGNDSDDWVLEHVVRVFKEAGWQRQAEETLAQALAKESVLCNTGECWLELLAAREVYLTPEEVEAQAARGQPGTSVLVGHALQLGARQRVEELLAFRNRFRDRIQDTASWSRFGHALVRAGRCEEAREWLSDWTTRKDVKPIVLMDLALSLRVMGNFEAAEDIHVRAQRMKGDVTSGMHEMWLALDAVLLGRIAEARETLKILSPGKLDKEPPYIWLRSLIQKAISASESPESSPPQTLDELRRQLPVKAVKKEADIPQVVLAVCLDRVRQQARRPQPVEALGSD